MSKTVPSFLFPTNFRNGKNIKRLIKDFNVQGYGIAIYLLETLAETEGHKYPIDDIDLLADEMKVSVPVINTVIEVYKIFELIEDEQGVLFISSQLNQWLEPYYKQIEQKKLAGRISAEKRRIKQKQQLLELSGIDSSEQQLNDRSTINKLINKKINKKISSSSHNFNWENKEDFEEFYIWIKKNHKETIKNERFYKNTLLENLRKGDEKTLENWNDFLDFKKENKSIERINNLVGESVLLKLKHNDLYSDEIERYILQVEINESEKNFILKIRYKENDEEFYNDILIDFSKLEQIESNILNRNAS